jgi:uncharacterized damage-inducible protein DinB
MSDVPALLRDLYGYHWWANRRLFDVAAALGEGTCAREVGKQFSFPTVKGMLAHIHGADQIWFSRFAGGAPGRLLGDADFATMADLRTRWGDLEKTQRTFLERLAAPDLVRPVTYTSALLAGRQLTLPLGALLQHVANHATHHRSELATMLTMLSGSPPGTDRVIYELMTSGQLPGEHAGWR